jgi:ribosome biogenesis GTPase A
MGLNTQRNLCRILSMFLLHFPAKLASSWSLLAPQQRGTLSLRRTSFRTIPWRSTNPTTERLTGTRARLCAAAAKPRSSRFPVDPPDDFDDLEESQSGYSRPVVQWYPGHIAKAERELSQILKLVDVVVEVRDARALKATSHPKVATWCAGRPRLVALTHGDQIPKRTISEWKTYFATFGAAATNEEPMNRLVTNQARQARRERSKYVEATAEDVLDSSASTVESVLFVNGATGSGIPALKRAIVKSGGHVQERRKARGLLPRPLRVCLLGYPNVGKSAILNKLIGMKRAPTSNRPGVTRTLQWIRVKDAEDLELLDSPGVIPATLVNQSDATLLAACNCIGEAAYDNQAVAAYLCDWLLGLYRADEKSGMRAAPEWPEQVKKRYKIDLYGDSELTGEDMLYLVAEYTCQGSTEDASRKILQDFRTGRMGPICLQLAPSDPEERTRDGVKHLSLVDSRNTRLRVELQQKREERAKLALETARDRGLELPPSIVADPNQLPEKAATDPNQIGRGLFEGW